MYGSSAVNLSLFDRASLIARAYQEYRITNVRFTFRPQFDTFTVNTDAPTALRVPQFYSMIDKAQAIPIGATIDTLRSMGARPKRFDDKNIVVKYAPGVQAVVWDGGALQAPSAPKISPWLSTNAAPDAAWLCSSVEHGGLFYILDTQGSLPGDGQYEYGVEVEIQVQFRKPLITVEAGATPAKNPLVRAI